MCTDFSIKFAKSYCHDNEKNLSVNIDYIYEYQFVLPQTEDYENVDFDKEFQYKKQ